MILAFDAVNRQKFAQNYPEIPHKLNHGLLVHELLTLEALAKLGEALPDSCVEYNRANQPIGVNPNDVTRTKLSIGDTIRQVEQSNSWAVLKNIEQLPEYNALLRNLLGELKVLIEEKTGAMLRPQAFVFVSSPNAVTPYHFDPEHNILLQLRGTKMMMQFPAGDSRYAPDEMHEGYHSGQHRNLEWRDSFLSEGTEHHLRPGEAVFVPVMAPHFVKNGPDVSISLSITWRSEWSFAESEARGMNRLLRKVGFQPEAPGRFPASNRGKALAYKAIRRTGLLGGI